MSEPFEQHEVWIELYDFEWTLIGPIDQFTDFKLERNDLGDEGIGNCQFKVPFELGTMQTDVTKDAATKTVYQWGPAGELHLMVWVRGRLEHSGVVVVMEDDEQEGSNSDPAEALIDVKVESWGDAQAYLSRRVIKGIGADRFAQTSVEADTAIANLINANCKTGDVIEPAGYAGLGVDRENFGSILVQATAAASSAVVDRMRWDHNDPLWDQVAEKCAQYDCRLTTSWDKAASPPVLTITVQDYLDVASDKTSDVVFSRENGGLRSCPRTVDLGKESNVAEVGGRGTRANRCKGYAIHQESYDAIGLMETGDVWASADDADAEDEAEFIIAQVGGSHTTYEPHIVEYDGCQWGEDFEFDKVTVDDSRRNITIEDWIVGAVFTLPAPQDLRIELKFGKEEPNRDRQQSRGGGGGSGGSRGGGTPKRKDGEGSSAKTVNTNDGTVTFDEAEDDLDLKGETGVVRLRPVTVAATDVPGEGTTEAIVAYCGADYYAGAPVPTGYVWVYAPNLGREVKLIARDEGSGNSDPHPPISGT
jgi:hypothetical protein